MELSPVYLYILIRTDLASLGNGKACAQVSHAANAAIFEARRKLPHFFECRFSNAHSYSDLITLVTEWENQTTQGFGTCIVLGAKESQMRKAVDIARGLNLHANIIHDPTYPLMDGETLHLIPLDTCAYILCRKGEAAIALQDLSLLP